MESGVNNDSSEEYKNKLAEVTPTARRHIFLIRHGQYEHDSPDVNGGSLTKKGETCNHLSKSMIVKSLLIEIMPRSPAHMIHDFK